MGRDNLGVEDPPCDVLAALAGVWRELSLNLTYSLDPFIGLLAGV